MLAGYCSLLASSEEEGYVVPAGTQVKELQFEMQPLDVALSS